MNSAITPPDLARAAPPNKLGSRLMVCAAVLGALCVISLTIGLLHQRDATAFSQTFENIKLDPIQQMLATKRHVAEVMLDISKYAGLGALFIGALGGALLTKEAQKELVEKLKNNKVSIATLTLSLLAVTLLVQAVICSREAALLKQDLKPLDWIPSIQHLLEQKDVLATPLFIAGGGLVALSALIQAKFGASKKEKKNWLKAAAFLTSILCLTLIGEAILHYKEWKCVTSDPWHLMDTYIQEQSKATGLLLFSAMGAAAVGICLAVASRQQVSPEAPSSEISLSDDPNEILAQEIPPEVHRILEQS